MNCQFNSALSGVAFGCDQTDDMEFEVVQTEACREVFEFTCYDYVTLSVAV